MSANSRILYQKGEREDFLQELHAMGYNTFCDGKIVISDNLVFCFFSYSQGEIAFFTPSQLHWKPNSEYRFQNLGGEFSVSWLVGSNAPSTDEEVIHIFLTEDDREFEYFGTAYLCRYSNPQIHRDASAVILGFELEDKPPKNLWLRFGGYPGWKITVYSFPYLYTEDSGDDDLGNGIKKESFFWERGDKFKTLNKISRLPHAAIWIERWENDSLNLLIAHDRGLIYYFRYEGDVGIKSRDPSYQGESNEVEEIEFIIDNGQADYYPAYYTIDKKLALKIVQYFLESEKLPDWIPWEDFSSE